MNNTFGPTGSRGYTWGIPLNLFDSKINSGNSSHKAEIKEQIKKQKKQIKKTNPK